MEEFSDLEFILDEKRALVVLHGHSDLDDCSSKKMILLKKVEFHSSKNLININNGNINKIMISNKLLPYQKQF